MGEGEGAAVQSRYNNAKLSTEAMAPDGGDGQNEDLLVPPPLNLLPPRGGEIFLRKLFAILFQRAKVLPTFS